MVETVYDSQIVGILAKMGDKGMSVQMLAKHLYNMNCSLFEDCDIDAMRRYVQQFVLRNSRSPLSLLERMERRGFYRLNPRRAFVPRQLVFSSLLPTTYPQRITVGRMAFAGRLLPKSP